MTALTEADTSRYADVDGLRLHYNEAGPSTGPAVILLHGGGPGAGGWSNFHRNIEAFAAAGFRTLLLDCPGFNKSGPIVSADPRGLINARAVNGLMDVLGIDKAHLVGASMGGTIAQTLAIEQPSRVRTLTSVMSTTGDPALPSPGYAVLSTIFKPAPRDLAGYTEHYITTWKHLRGGAFPEEEARDRARAALNHARGLCPDGGARQLVAILASGSRREALRQVNLPTLVIHGDKDNLIFPIGGERTAELIPGARYELIEGMGHDYPPQLWRRWTDLVVGHIRDHS